MGIIVQKYGGSSVADIAKIGEVARQVVARHKAGQQVVVVVSAMGKTTDQLLAMAREVSPTPPRRELDMLVTAGERISMALLSMAIHDAGASAISFTGSQCGIITEDSHGGARIIEVKPFRIIEALNDGRVVIVAGYQGVSTKKEITTLGRGGSDTTAVALAAALDAEACEIYSDVDGVYSADPRVCPQAQLLPTISYEQMQAMAGAGAKVLNADAVEFARKAGIAIHARKTADPSGRETVVHAADSTHEPAVVAVVGAKDVSWVYGAVESAEACTVDLLRVGCKPFACAARWAERSASVATSPVGRGPCGLDLLLRRTDVASEAALADVVSRHGLTAEACGAVTLVGAELAVRDRIYDALGPKAPIRAWFATDMAFTLVVPTDAVDAMVRELHGRLVEKASASADNAHS